MNARHRNVLREGLDGAGFCENLGFGKRMYYAQYSNERGGYDVLEKIIKLIDHSNNDIIINHICQESGGVFVKSVEADDSKHTIYQCQSRVISELSDVIRVLTNSCADGKLTTKEIEEIKLEVDQFNREIYGVIQSAEKGKYNE